MIKYHAKQMKILVAMAENGFNQATLSESAKLSKSTLSLFLNRKRSLSATSAKKLSSALGRDLDHLFEIEIREPSSEKGGEQNLKCTD